MSGTEVEPSAQLLGDIHQRIEGARRQASVALDACQTASYWHIGRRNHTELLDGERAACGAQIVATVSRQLVQAYGRGFTEKNLRHTVLHPKNVLQAKMHEAIALSRARLESRSGEET